MPLSPKRCFFRGEEVGRLPGIESRVWRQEKNQRELLNEESVKG